MKRIKRVEAERQKRMAAVPKTSPVREEVYGRCGSETAAVADDCCRDFACYDRGRPTLSDLIESIQLTIGDIQEEIDNWEEAIGGIQEIIDEQGDAEL